MSKNVMIVDGAVNCAYDIWRWEEDLFLTVFNKQGTNIAFWEDVDKSTPEWETLISKAWEFPVKKKDVSGIDGIIFVKLQQKKPYYPTLKDSDLDKDGRSWTHD